MRYKLATFVHRNIKIHHFDRFNKTYLVVKFSVVADQAVSHTKLPIL